MRFKRFLSLSLALILILSLIPPVSAIDAPPEIEARQAVVYNPDTDTYVFEKNGDDKAYPTALTKLMTALLVLEKSPDLFVETTVNGNAIASVEGSSNASLKAGEIMTVKNLLYCMVLQSANDAANVLAEHVAGTVGDFVALMNAKAESLGMTNTHFTNPTGLHDDNMVTSARDMVKLVQYAAKNPELMEILNTSYKRIPATNMTASDRYYSTGNHLISEYITKDYFYKSASGMMAGSTKEGGYCLATVSTQNGYSYICVVLGSSRDNDNKITHSFTDAKSLLEYAHKNFTLLQVIEENSPVKEVPVELAQGKDTVVVAPVSSCTYLFPANVTLEAVEQKVEIQETVTAPLEKGQVLGTLTFVFEGKEYGSVPLASQSTVERSTFLYILYKIKTFFTSFWVKLILCIILFLIILYALLIFYVNKKKNHRRRGPRRAKYLSKK